MFYYWHSATIKNNQLYSYSYHKLKNSHVLFMFLLVLSILSLIALYIVAIFATDQQLKDNQSAKYFFKCLKYYNLALIALILLVFSGLYLNTL